MTDALREPVVVAARRTPVGTAGHGLAGLDVTGLLVPVLQAVVADVAALLGEDPRVEEVVIGNCLGPGGNPARVATLAAGLGLHVPAVTVDRQCGSGQEAVHQAAALVRAGQADLVLAGGVESASTAPWRMWPPAGPDGQPVRYRRAPFAPRGPDGLGDPDMGPAADELARQRSVTRQRQDHYAVRSHALTRGAAAAGRYDAELVPVAGVEHDERPRHLELATLARLRPAFGQAGTVTAGNSCGISDGAAVVAVVSEQVRQRHGIPGLAVQDWVSVGVHPATPGIGPVPAVSRLLRRAGLDIADVGVLEVTEAFAAQVLACTDALGLDPLGVDADRVCPQGGAIAMGHPWGASGALLVVRLFAELVRADGPELGVATCAVGGGQGLALLARRVGP
ncbi:MAG TPA: thiolase family protein [Dermatophilaceae bacterium]|nr:thiolase family protein [Dermatophilaceae bacterium]